MRRNLFLLFLVLGLAVSLQAQTPHSKLHVEFDGNKIFSSDQLLEKLNPCIAKYPDEKPIILVSFYEYCLRKDVQRLMLSQGYLSSKIAEPKLENGKDGLTLRVSIEEGLQYRLGSISIAYARQNVNFSFLLGA